MCLLLALAWDAAAVPHTGKGPSEGVVVIDTAIDDWRTLAAGVDADTTVVRVAPGQDGIAALRTALAGRAGVRSLQLFSHGTPGAIRLGGTRLDEAALEARSGDLRAIRAALAADAEILLFGCDVGRGERGRGFLERLAALTGAATAGSTDITGSAGAGADWKLEARVGHPNGLPLVSRQARRAFQGRLAITSEVTFGFSKYDGSLGNGDPYNATIEADGTTDQMTFSDWRIDEFDDPDFGVNMNNGGPDSVFSDPVGDNFQFVSFTTEVFCGTSWSFDVVGYKDGSPVAGASQSYVIGGIGGPTTRSVGFASVDEVRFENYATDNGNQCLVIDDIVVDAEVVSNTAPGFSNLDATVVYDEAAGMPVIVDADATVSDTELDGAGDYAGSTLTVARESGANADDDFGFDTGAGTFTVSGGDLLAGGNVFASFTDNSGTLTVNFNSSGTAATPALVDDVLQGVTYANTGSPVVVEYGLTLNFDDGGLQTSQSVPAEFDPVLTAITANTTYDFTELGPELPNLATVDARIISESTFELLFHGFQFGDASESGSINSNELQLDQVTSDAGTTGVRFEADEPFSLESIDIDNFSTFAQDVTVHAYLGGSLVASRLFSYGASSGYQTRQFASADDAFSSVDEIRVTTSVNDSVALDNIVVDQANTAPTVSPAIATLDLTVVEDGAIAPISLVVDDAETGPGSVVVTAGSDNQTLIPDANLTVTDDGGGDRTLSITLAPDENGTANITVTLDDGTTTVSDSFQVTVTAQNDPPSLSLDQNSNAIPENNAGNVAVAQITIVDDNEDGSTNNLSLSGADAGDFAVNGSALEFAGSADFETKSTYDVNVDVDDPGVGGNPDDTAAFTLSITNVDEPPVFTAVGPFSVSESGGNGTAVGDVDADDGDGGAPDANVTYAIVGGNTGGAFAIDGATGAITVADASAVDFDTSPTFTLDVEADDGTNAPTTAVTVNVLNAPPSTPVDSDGASGGSVAEDAANGTMVGVTADAADPGGGNVSYALTDNAGGRFQINAGTGVVTVADASLIDFESAPSHTVTIQASDDDGADSGTASFSISVTDVDSPPAFTANGPFSVGEAPSNGTAVGDVDANDGDAGAADAGITYAITGGNVGGAFAIDNAGVIAVADGSQIDFESSASFALTVEADDGGSTTSATVNVNVGDEPPSTPIDTDGAADSVAEDATNGTGVGVDVSAVDPAGGAVNFALTDSAGGRFTIDGSGLVTVADATGLDFESASSHAVDIVALDADGTTSSTLTVIIAVTDAPDVPTVTAPPDLTGPNAVDATGLYTLVDLERDGAATANDDEDGTLTPLPGGGASLTQLRPGTHSITWSVTDSDGSTVTDDQVVEVRPRVGLGPDRTVQEGTTVAIPVELNGEAIDSTTPVIDFDVAGTGSASAADYAGLGEPGSIAILAGKLGTLGFDVLDDGSGESPETLDIALTGTGGSSVLAQRTRTTFTIVETNTPPIVSLSAAQGGNDPAVVIDGTAGAGSVTMTAATSDATATGNMSFAWNGSAAGLTDTDGVPDDETFVFDPTGVAPGIYEIEVQATDDGATARTGTASLRLRIRDPFPALGSGDTDGDGTPDDDATERLPDRDADGLPDYRDPYRDRSTVHQAIADGAGYRIETEPGLDLAIGRVAFAVDRNGAMVSAADINNVLGATDVLANVGGYFDFTVRGLPTPGASVNVVVPQRAPVPANAVVRKLSGSAWGDFVEDGANALASAAGAPGYCPPTDSPAYTGGLTQGHFCVRLTIEDGGPNDADGAANGRIEDPHGVAMANTAPIITNAPAGTVAEDAAYSYVPAVDDPDTGDTSSFTIVNQPAWASFDAGTGELSGTPVNGDVGTYGGIEITVADGAGATDTVGPFSIQVTNTNDPPTIGGTPPAAVAEGGSYSFTPTAGDVDAGDSLTFGIANPPSWATFNSNSGALTGTPADADVGVYGNIRITVTDDMGASATLGPFSIEVTDVNTSPVANPDDYDFPIEGGGMLDVPAPGVLGNDTDPDGDSLSAVLVQAPAHGTLDLRPDGSFTYRPDAGFSGTDEFLYLADDGVATVAKAQSAPGRVRLHVPASASPIPALGTWGAWLLVALTVIAASRGYRRQGGRRCD